MSERMDDISKEHFMSLSTNEDKIIDKIEKEKFFKILDLYGFNHDKLKLIFSGCVYNNNTRNRLNNILRNIKTNNGIKIYNSILFFEEFNKIKKIINFLDEDSICILEKELSDKYNIDVDITDLDDLLE